MGEKKKKMKSPGYTGTEFRGNSFLGRSEVTSQNASILMTGNTSYSCFIPRTLLKSLTHGKRSLNNW